MITRKAIESLYDLIQQNQLPMTARYNLGKGMQEYSLQEIARGLGLEEKDVLMMYLNTKNIYTATVETMKQKSYSKTLRCMESVLGADFMYGCLTPEIAPFYLTMCQKKARMLQELHILCEQTADEIQTVLRVSDMRLFLCQLQEMDLPYYTKEEERGLLFFLQVSKEVLREPEEREWSGWIRFWGSEENARLFGEDIQAFGKIRLTNMQLKRMLEYIGNHQLMQRENQIVFKRMAEEEGIHIPGTSVL